jgi:hypothetical protein
MSALVMICERGYWRVNDGVGICVGGDNRLTPELDIHIRIQWTSYYCILVGARVSCQCHIALRCTSVSFTVVHTDTVVLVAGGSKY